MKGGTTKCVDTFFEPLESCKISVLPLVGKAKRSFNLHFAGSEAEDSCRQDLMCPTPFFGHGRETI